MRSKHKVLGISAAAAAACALAIPAFATPPGSVAGDYVESTPSGAHKVTICHRTGSATNPYVIITVDIAAVDGEGARDHDHHDHVGNGPIGDVIPPVPGNEDGKNWMTAGYWPAGQHPTLEHCTTPAS